MLLPECIHRRVDFLQRAARRVFHDQRPGLIGLAQSHGIRVTRAAIPAERFAGDLGHVGAAHHHRHAHGANGVGDAVRLGDHAGHRADAHQRDLVVDHVPDQVLIAHGMRVAVDQQHLVVRGRQRLQQKHPQVRHEVPGHAVIGAIQEYLQRGATAGCLGQGDRSLEGIGRHSASQLHVVACFPIPR